MLSNHIKDLFNKNETLVSLVIKDKIKLTENLVDQTIEFWHEEYKGNKELHELLGIPWEDYQTLLDTSLYDLVIKQVEKQKTPLASSNDNSGDLIENDLFEMSNLHQSDTGIPNIIWVSAKNANHGARVKIQWGDTVAKSISISIHKTNPTVMAGNEKKVKSYIIDKVKEWIILNYDVLMQYWKQEISTRVMLDSINKITAISDKELKENFHVCLVCKGTGKTRSGQPCKMCEAEWKSKSVTSVEETMVDGGNKDNTTAFQGFDRSWDL